MEIINIDFDTYLCMYKKKQLINWNDKIMRGGSMKMYAIKLRSVRDAEISS